MKLYPDFMFFKASTLKSVHKSLLVTVEEDWREILKLPGFSSSSSVVPRHLPLALGNTGTQSAFL